MTNFLFLSTAHAHGLHAETGAPHLIEHVLVFLVPAVIALALGYAHRKMKRVKRD